MRDQCTRWVDKTTFLYSSPEWDGVHICAPLENKDCCHTSVLWRVMRCKQ